MRELPRQFGDDGREPLEYSDGTAVDVDPSHYSFDTECNDKHDHSKCSKYAAGATACRAQVGGVSTVWMHACLTSRLTPFPHDQV